jgi:hypothetical protein
MAYGKIRVCNPKEQDAVKVPSYLKAPIYDETNNMSLNKKRKNL